jgi:Skp family chaperone for outer membrane proteins
MRAAERLLLIGGVALTIGVFASARLPVGAESGPASTAEQRIATADLFGLIEKIMDRPAMREPRDNLANALNEKVAAAQKVVEALQAELQAMQPADPQAQVRQQQFFERRDEFNRLYQDSAAELDRFRAAQLFEAYREARTGADAVAGRIGYTIVIANRSPEAELAPQGMALGIQELLARPVLRHDAADDITSAIEQELKLAP